MREADKRDQIKRLNDQFRRSLNGGRVVVTAGVQHLGQSALNDILRAVRCFCDFEDNNDPYGEHDFGRIDVLGYELLWKIDYYDLTATFGSPDPSDLSVTLRVMTIMLAEEY